VTATGGPSHPIALPVPGTGDYKTPTTAVLDAASKVQCQSCHKVHYSPTADGTLLRVSNAANQLCDDCHTTRTVANKGVHFDATLGVVWPGGQYGTPASTYAARTTAERGNCVNCHDPHGWPDARNTTQHYAKLLGDDRTNLCLACHDATPQGAAPNVNTEITKANHHPIERTSGRTVRCLDCHNAHKALKGSYTYSTTATSTRNAVSNVLKSVPGVTPTWGGIWAAPSAYTTTASAAYEYQICFKCHTSHDSFGTTRPGGVTTYYATGTAKFTNGSTTVAGTGTTWTSAMVGMYIQKDVASPAYRITAATATSITLANAYTGTTDATAAAYKITRQQTDLAVEFNPANRSGHPVVTGLNNYTGSPAPKALATTYLKAPWNSNVGTQTMMCSDCHNTDGAAAQGPHGSAAQFMLKGTNPANWPNVTLTNFSTSWCANCHNNFTSGPHGSNHSSYACWNCHTVIPHGSKRSRLIGDRTNMPARYAYNNTLTNMPIQGFKKATSPTTYQKNYCQASCASDHSTAVSGSEVW
jgi:predicted CXXCH cytochrome family protein